MGSVNGSLISSDNPLLSFGVITDVQYANVPDGHSFTGVPRYYRHSMLVLKRAVKEWNNHRNLKFLVNFGDIIDGSCPKDESKTAIRKVINEFETFNGPTFHMIGNHCLYNLPRGDLLKFLKFPTFNQRAYYDFTPIPEFRFVVLDGYDVSAIGWPEDHPNSVEAMRFLEIMNPNSEKNSPNGLIGASKRFLKFNGGVGREQLQWLDHVLQESTDHAQKVIICCHLPLDPDACYFESLLWNYDEVMSIIHRYRCVKVCFAGHNHRGGYSVDSHGIHHRVLEAALECPPGTYAFGHVDVYHDRLFLHGIDRMASTEMIFTA